MNADKIKPKQTEWTMGFSTALFPLDLEFPGLMTIRIEPFIGVHRRSSASNH